MKSLKPIALATLSVIPVLAILSPVAIKPANAGLPFVISGICFGVGFRYCQPRTNNCFCFNPFNR